jgi:type II secretory pathway predicted ATPase ExeA
MYETFFQLEQRPFGAAARIDRYFPANAIETARQTLARCIERAEGAGMLVGPPGSGKTLLCQLLAEQFREVFEIALLSNGHLGTRRELLQAILFELKLPFRRMDEGELRLSLIDHLSDERAGRTGLLLVVDEAHTFPLRLLEEVRLITNLVRHGQPRVRLVLAGGPSLEEHFARPRLAAFSQRIASRCYLEPWQPRETRQYVINQLAMAGGDARRTFTDDALTAIHRATDGVPRLVNQLCDHALILAFAGGRDQLSGDAIEEAWADLQQLPSPWNDGPADDEAVGAVPDDLIEFGDLDDENDGAIQKQFESPLPAVGRPTVLLREIEDHLTLLEDDFAPVATIGRDAAWPSVRHVNPFHESFDEEELLVDRYASFEAGQFGQVRSREGEALSALLEPHLRPLPTPQFTVFAAGQAEVQANPTCSPSESACGPARLFASHSVDAISAPCDVGWNTATSELTAQRSTESSAPLRPQAANPPARTTRSEPQPANPVDDDLMVVEEDPPAEGQAPPTRGISPARRQEYRQLFSMLRKG